MIRTRRLDLLPLRVEHATEMAAVLADPALHEFIGGEPLDATALLERYERLATGSPEPDQAWLNWVLRRRHDAQLVGTVQATITEISGRANAEIAWIVGTPWQGRGFAKEAAMGLVDWLRALRLDHARLASVVAHVHPDHTASASVASAAGLARTDRTHDGEIRWELSLER